MCFAFAGIKAGALIPCKLCSPPNNIGLYLILIDSLLFIILFSL